MQNIWDELPKPYFVLAPMDDVTDTVFRRIVGDCAAPDVFFTEFVNVDGLQSPGRKRLLNRLQFTPKETPLIAQIWGKTPENYYKTAKELADGTFALESSNLEDTNFAGIDLNFGCPDKAVVKNGCCVALVNDRPLAQEIIQATKEGAGGKLPVSVKTRLGFNEVDYSWPEFLLEQDIAVLTMHGRTRKQMSKVPADWDAIGKVRELRDKLGVATHIVGNGDVMTRQQGLELATTHQLDGIMIGRGIFQDPYVFTSESPWHKMGALERLELYKKHVELFAETWGDTGRHVRVLNKFCKVYINDFPSAKHLREQLMNAQHTDELLQLLEQATKYEFTRA
jgi:tRNA-dihydrouridine synthase